jgi:hypothetical protein
VLQGSANAPLAQLGQITFPVMGAPAEVAAFSAEAPVVEQAEQDAVDRLSAKMQELHDSLPDEERLALVQIMAQAAAYAWSETQ